MTTPEPAVVWRWEIAQAAQRELDDSTTAQGTIADHDHFGERVANGIPDDPTYDYNALDQALYYNDLRGVPRAVASALDDWLYSNHQIAASHFHPGQFLRLLDEAGYTIRKK